MADRKRKRISKEDSYKPEKLDDGSAVTVEEAKKDKS